VIDALHELHDSVPHSTESAEERLRNSPAVAAAVQREIDRGLLARIGASMQPSLRGDRALESTTQDHVLEAIVQRVGRPPLLIRKNVVELNTGVDDNLDDFPPGTDALIRGTERSIPSDGSSS
jgi:endonuclease G, mitochondrial